MQRESNIELLRIVVMLFIILHHLIVHAIYPDVLEGHNGCTSAFMVYSVLEGFLYVAVNVFILISGYFGIRLRARKIWSLYLQCAFYGLLTYLFGVIVGTVEFVPHTLITKSVLIFSHLSSWWFVVCYLILMILSPLLNFGMSMMRKKEYMFVLICMTFLQIYLGWFWQKSVYDVDGYNILNFIYLYLIGGYIARFVSNDKPTAQRNIIITTYIICAIAFAGCNIIHAIWKIPFGNVWGYNNPIVIIGAISLFLFARTFEVQSKVINLLASGVLAAYLMTDIPYVGDFIYREYSELASMIPSMVLTIVVTICAAICVVLLACCIDVVRSFMMKPIIGAFDGVDRWTATSEEYE